MSILNKLRQEEVERNGAGGRMRRELRGRNEDSCRDYHGNGGVPELLTDQSVPITDKERTLMMNWWW